jgi:hypothetical protein
VPIVLQARTLQALGITKFPTPEDDSEMLKTFDRKK